MNTIAGDIFTWSWFSEPHGYNFNGLLVPHPDGNLAIDPVEISDADLDKLKREGVAKIVITNRNHVRAGNRIRSETGARSLIHTGDEPYARSQGAEIDGNLTVGGTVGPFSVIGVPGKSPGEVALFWPQRRILVVGDAVIGNPPGSCGLLREKVMDDPSQLRGSIRELLKLDFDTMLVGDGVPILSDARSRLEQLISSFPK